jgi:hypothetical protein
MTLPGAALLLIAVACRGSGNAERAGAPATAAASATPGVSHETVGPAPRAVPTAIDAIGRYGSTIYLMVMVGNWAGARSAADSFQPMLDSIPAVATIAARELRRTIVIEDRSAALRAANHLTQLGALLSAPYRPAVPAEVMLLAFDGRELEIWAAQGDLTRLRETASAIRCNWSAVRQRVVARNGIPEAAKFDAIVAQVGTAATAADYGRLATSVFAGGDALEQVFAR